MRDRDMGDDALILPPRANPRRMFFGNDTEPQETRKPEVRLPTAAPYAISTPSSV